MGVRPEQSGRDPRARRVARVMGCVGLAALMCVATACPKKKKCEVDYTVQSSWNGGFVAEILVTNLRPNLAFNGWILQFPSAAGSSVEDEAHTKLLVSIARSMDVPIDTYGYAGHGSGGLPGLGL